MTLLLILHCPLSAHANDKVRLQLKWQHQFQFAGYYAAEEKGYYQAAGLDVEFIPGKPGDDPVQLVLQGKAEFGVGSTELLQLREQGKPLVALAVIFQHSPLVLMTLKQNALQSIHDLAGRKIMIEPNSAELYAYLQKEGLPRDKFTPFPHSFQMKDMLSGAADAMSIYVTDEPFELSKAGQEYLLYSPRSVGIDFYGDNLFTTESQLKLKPEMVKAFRAASLKGWEYAMQHQEELVQLIYSRYSQRHSIEHLRFEARQMEPLLQTTLVEIGHMKPGRWRHIADTYTGLGMLKPDFDFKGFLYDPNPPPPDLKWFYGSIAAAVTLLLVVGLIALRFSRLSASLKNNISEYEQTVTALQESEEKHRILFQNSPDAYLIIVDGIFVDCNRAAVTMLRSERSQIIGQPPDLISPEFQPDGRKSSESAEEKIKDAFKNGINTFDWVHLRLDRSAFFVEVSIAPMMLNGQPALFTTWRDITKRKEAENTLVISEMKYRTLYDSTSDAVMLLDDRNFIDCNKATLEMFGCAMRDQFCSTHPGDLSPPKQPNGMDSMTLANQHIATAKKVGSHHFEWMHRRIDNGEEFHAEVLLNSMELDGRPILQATVRNITERKLAKEALEESNRRLEILSTTDALTGIANRRHFDEMLAQEHARHARSGAKLSLILLDIDHFKEFNDIYGHVKGDECLRLIGQVLAECAIRPADLAARYGGEEFVFILPETDSRGAVIIAEKIRSGIQALAIPHRTSSTADCVTASLGVFTMHCSAGVLADDILAKVDELLYRAKSSGRNRIEFVAADDLTFTSEVEEIKGSFVRLIWKESFCSGNQLIDTQHRYLFTVSNNLLDAVLSGRSSTEISDIITQLLDDVSQHFQYEQIILESANFQGLDRHIAEHAELLKKGLELSEQFKASTLSVGDVFQFLVSDVVLEHMLGADREYFPFIRNATDT